MRIGIQLRAKQLINLDLKKRWKSQKLFSCQSLEWETPLNIFYFWGLMIEKQTPNKEGVWYYTSVQEDRNDFGVSKASLSRPRFTCSSGGRTGRLCKMLKAWRSARGADEMCLQTRMKLKHKHFIFNREDSQLTSELQSCWWGDCVIYQPFW